MIAAWMLYSVAVTLLLLAGATAAEYVARAVRAPTRVVWAVATIAALGLSARALIVGHDSRRQTQESVSTVAARTGVGTLVNVDTATLSAREPTAVSLFSRVRDALRATASSLGRIEQYGASIDVRRFDAWNGVLGALWMGASIILLSLLVASITRARRMQRGLATTTVGDYSVFLSHDLGPAVLGVWRARVVLPEWVLALPGRQRDAILAHEREHAAAFDPALLTVAMFLVTLQPWNIALWILTARLRVALEGDCDRRVLDAMGDDHGRWYGRLLILVYERATLGPSLSIGFVNRPSNLERRIRRIMLKPRVLSLAGVTSLFVVVMLVATACRAAAPVRRESPPAEDRPVALQPSERPAARTTDRAPSPRSADRAPPPLSTEPAPTPGPPEPRESVPAADGRCSIVARRTQAPGEHTVLWPGRWPVSDGCAIDGDIVVAYLDSTSVLVAARDTADVGITAFFIFKTKAGTTTPDLIWSTTNGRAELSDTTMSFISSDARTRPLVFRLDAAQTGAPRTGVLELRIDEMMMMEMNGIPWEIIARLPDSPRCTITQQESDTMPNVGLERVAVMANHDGPGQRTTGEKRRACFVIRGSRFEVPIL